MGEVILTMKDIDKSFPGVHALDHVNFEVKRGERVALIGNNGTGKTTILKIINELISPDAGTVTLGSNVHIGYYDQEHQQLHMEKTIFDEIADDYPNLNNTKVRNVLAAFLFTDDDVYKRIEDLSGGERGRVALAKLMLSDANFLILDEPTNHLDITSKEILESALNQYTGTVFFVSHDRYFLDNVTGWILELDRGQGIPYEGNYSSWLEQKRKRLEQEEKEETARQRTLASELEWIRKNPKARQAKSKARINAYDELLQAAAKDKITTANINIPMTERLGDLVIEAEHITKGYGDRILIDDLSFKIPKGAIVGIIGPNGAGKTTLFRMITGQEKPDSGTIRIGDTVDLGYVDQSRDELNPDKNVWEEISDGLDMITLGKKEFPSRAYVGQFNFKGGDQQKKVGQLSGGERNRLHLALALKEEGNVLLLDEPTNDLDVDTLRSLEEGIMNYPGCVLVTSHDRWFLDRLATHILAYEGNGHVEWFEGNFEEYEKDKIRRLGEDACNPHAMKYKPLER